MLPTFQNYVAFIASCIFNILAQGSKQGRGDKEIKNLFSKGIYRDCIKEWRQKLDVEPSTCYYCN